MITDGTGLSSVSGNKPVCIVLDSREDENGRALFSLSALHMCAAELRGATIHALGSSGIIVNVALDAFSFDTGILVRHFAQHDAAAALEAADLYLSISLSSVDPVWAEDAKRLGVPLIVASQFPALAANPAPTLPARFAHDTRQLAGRIRQTLDKRL